MDESAISFKSPKAVAGWLAAASDRQLGAATTIACFRPQAGDRERQLSGSSSGELVPQSRLARGPSARDGAKHCPDAVHCAALPHRSRTARESVRSKVMASRGGSRRKRRSSVRAEPCCEPAGPAPAHPHGALPAQPGAVRLDLPRTNQERTPRFDQEGSCRRPCAQLTCASRTVSAATRPTRAQGN